MDQVKLTIDGKTVEIPKGTTIYKAAKELGIEIPILCYMDLKDLNIEHQPGGCRICSVEIERRRNLAPSSENRPGQLSGSAHQAELPCGLWHQGVPVVPGRYEIHR